VTQLQAGVVLAQRYRIDALAGAGGMGTVYRAFDEHTRTVCAVKVLAGEPTERAKARFAQEAVILAGVKHPAIVRYLGHGPTFLVMEWVDGESLAERLRTRGATPEDALRLGERLVLGLVAVHAAGIVHRDLKPRNVMLPNGSFDDAKIVDFGVARADASEGTGTGIRLGTPRYMAPEQIVSSRRVDGRADVFSLGCVLFEMLTGRKAFRGTDEVAVLARMVIEDAPRVRSVRSDIPIAVDALVARLLERSYKRRSFATAELAESLASARTSTRGLHPVVAGVDADVESTAGETTFDDVPRSTLPPLPPPSPLPWPTLGRTEDIARLETSLSPGKVVGVWGALGIGKSHLAQDVALRVFASRGAIVCDLRGAVDADDALRLVASTLGVWRETSTLDVCAAVAGRRGPLVVLDTSDGVLGAASALARQIVSHAVASSVLVVSRARPDGVDTAIELGPLTSASSVELLIARSRGHASNSDTKALGTIAAELQGNALALTLAASRVSVLGVAKVAERLEQPLGILGSATTASYPLSLRQAIEAVWETLTEAERRTAQCCALFHGAIRPDIAEEAFGNTPAEAAATLDGLKALRDRSLLRQGADGTLVMDRALHDLAREKGAAPESRERLARTVIACASRARARALDGDFDASLELGALESDLLRAFDWAVSNREAALALAAALALDVSLGARGPLAKLANVLDQAIDLKPDAPVELARALAARGRVAAVQGAFDVADDRFGRALTLAGAGADAELEASIWLDRAVMHHTRGDLAAAERDYKAVLGVHAAAASRAEARAHGNLGALAHDRGDLDGAYAGYVNAIAVAESIGDARLLGVFLCNLAVLDREHGRASEARHRFVRAIHSLEVARERRLLGIAYGNLGMLELEMGRDDAALSAFEQSTELLAALGDAQSEALAQARLAAVLAVRGDPSAAENALSRAERLARDPSLLEVVRFFRVFPECARARARGDAWEAFRDRAHARMASITPKQRGADDDVRCALRVLRARLNPD
jgi:tetratricopeptide (TPR) repeat protein